jgi:hypothetical protein
MNLRNFAWEKWDGRCVVCQITEQEGDFLDVYSIFQERPINTNSVDPLEFIILCQPCRKDIQAHFNKGLASIGVIKKYLRVRGAIVAEIDARRKTPKNT